MDVPSEIVQGMAKRRRMSVKGQSDAYGPIDKEIAAAMLDSNADLLEVCVDGVVHPITVIDDAYAGDRTKRDFATLQDKMYASECAEMNWVQAMDAIGCAPFSCSSSSVDPMGISFVATEAPTSPAWSEPGFMTTQELQDYESLLELIDAGEQVSWPEGMVTVKQARELVVKHRPAKQRKVEQPIEADDGQWSYGPSKARSTEELNSHRMPTPPTKRRRISLCNVGRDHQLFVSGDILWCLECGYWSTSRVRRDGLGGACNGLNDCNKTILSRLKSSVHPKNRRVRLPRALPLH